MVSKIEQIIEEIEELIDGCKYATFSSTKILVDKEEIDELLQELKTHTPDEIMRCQKIISNKDAILADAQRKADALVREAQNYSDQMVSEHEIMQQAYEQAGEIVRQAKYQAQEMLQSASEQAQNYHMSAMQYTDDSLANIQNILAASIQETQTHSNDLINSLSQILNVVNNNRAELHPEEELNRDLLIANRAEQERMMMGENIPVEDGMGMPSGDVSYGAVPEGVPEDTLGAARGGNTLSEPPSANGGVSAVTGAPASGGAPVSNASAASAAPEAEAKEPPKIKAIGGVIRGGISKSITQ